MLRVSGANAMAIARRHVTPWPSAPRVATLCRITGSDGTLLDQTLVTVFPGPRSYTGDDVVEIASREIVIRRCGTHLVIQDVGVKRFAASGAEHMLGGAGFSRCRWSSSLDLARAGWT